MFRAAVTACLRRSAVEMSGVAAPAFTTTPKRELATGLSVPGTSFPSFSSTSAASSEITMTSPFSPALSLFRTPLVVPIEKKRVPRRVGEFLAQFLKWFRHGACGEHRQFRGMSGQGEKRRYECERGYRSLPHVVVYFSIRSI